LQAGQARLHASERTRPGTRTQIYNIYWFSTAIMIRKRASVLRYAYMVCLVCI
jgi:hypothetical protein